ncbi:MAG: hypothetical protein ABSA97_06880 [Verrucomicrobiia bacterium]
MPIYISENAFITLTLSAIETSTRYESTGLLLGHQSKDMFYVEEVIPYQLAERTANSVSVPSSRQNRMRRVFKNYMKYKIIGEFHTHPDASPRLSNGDKNWIRRNGYELEIVVAIRKRKEEKRSHWRYKNKLLSGSIDRYFIEIACWRVQDDKVAKLRIRCPFAVGFGFSKPI